MRLHCLGLSHTSAPLALREKLTLSDEQIRAAIARLSCGHDFAPIQEMIILSTCNRLELYAASSRLIFDELEIFLSATRGIDPGDFLPHVYRYNDLAVVQHLFDVSAGLDSLVIGEPQILGQITRALELSRGQNIVGPVLNRLFQSAIHAGKRARTETAISRNPASVSSLAASVAEKSVAHITTANVLVLGAGEMAELSVEALRKRGADRIKVINRTTERAWQLAQRWGAECATFENLQEAICDADIVISSTGAPHIVIEARMVEIALTARPDRPLIMLDIAVPRDIDPQVALIPRVKLFDIDHLNTQLEDSLTQRMNEIPQVKAILAEEYNEFSNFLKSLEMLPVISDIRHMAESIRMDELEKTLRRMPDLTDAERQRIEALTQSLVKKLLDNPTRRLRAEATCPHAPEYATVARTLFGLKHESGLCGFSSESCPIQTAAD